jgi:hypothetical protein
MSSKWKWITVVSLLIALGSGLALYKVRSLGVPFWKGEQVDEWQVEARLSFAATGGKVKARLSLPTSAVEEESGQEAGSLGYHYNVEKNLGEYTAVCSRQNIWTLLNTPSTRTQQRQ